MTSEGVPLEARRGRLLEELPPEGLFEEKTWKLSPVAYRLSPQHLQLLERLGPVLQRFQQACDLLYRQSVSGKKPEWISRWLDAGKPKELIEFSRSDALRGQVPAVLRPDLVLTETGFALCEIDAIPGGIGLTAWLQETYSALGENVLGTGMRAGFNWIFPEGDIVISEEAASYRPEYEWLVGKDRVKRAEEYQANGVPIYRFFEGFDWENLEMLRTSLDSTAAMTPPMKPYLEEKLWLAMFWLKPLREFWRRELGEKGVQLLEQVIPYSWVVDPTPLPPHAAIPQLELHDWHELSRLSQKERALVLKVSGFSPQAWGSRGVWIGSDLSTAEWTSAVELALSEFPKNPRILQRFVPGVVREHSVWNEAGEIVPMPGRARVSPYYFAKGDEVRLGGVLVTHCPPDKKRLHGMKDAILVPASSE